MKVNKSITIFFNIILISNLYNTIYYEKYFHNYEEIEVTMAISSQLLADSNVNTVDDVQHLLNRKPKIKAPLDIFFNCSSEKVDCSAAEINTLLQESFIDDISFNNVIENALRKKIELKNEYAATMGHKDVMMEGKLKQRDVDKEVEAFHNLHLSKTYFSQYDLKNLSQKEKRFILQSVLLDLRIFETSGKNKVASLVGGKCICTHKYFGVSFPRKFGIPMDEVFEAEIGVGAYSSEFSDGTSIFWDGKRVELKDGIGTLAVKAEKIGYQKHEAVLMAMDKNRTRVHVDTTYFEFYVSP